MTASTCLYFGFHAKNTFSISPPPHTITICYKRSLNLNSKFIWCPLFWTRTSFLVTGDSCYESS